MERKLWVVAFITVLLKYPTGKQLLTEKSYWNDCLKGERHWQKLRFLFNEQNCLKRCKNGKKILIIIEIDSFDTSKIYELIKASS